MWIHVLQSVCAVTIGSLMEAKEYWGVWKRKPRLPWQTVSGNADLKKSTNEDCLPARQQWLLCSVQMQDCVWGSFVLTKFCLKFCLSYFLTTAAFILVATALGQDGLEQVPSVGHGAHWGGFRKPARSPSIVTFYAHLLPLLCSWE